jgi:hypothetical protein
MNEGKGLTPDMEKVTDEFMEENKELMSDLAEQEKAVTKLPGNRRNRRGLAAVARRIANRPGTGYNKRSAAGGRQGHQSAQRTLIIQMQDNAQVIDNVATGRLDKYLEAK